MNFPEWGKPSNLDISSLFFISVVKFVLLVYGIVSVRYINTAVLLCKTTILFTEEHMSTSL